MLLFTTNILAVSFSFGESIATNDEEELLDFVLQNQNYCIEKTDGYKLYLKPKKVYITNQGAFLRINRFYLVQLYQIFSDEEGCYIFSQR
jgi:hypothetical protein